MKQASNKNCAQANKKEKKEWLGKLTTWCELEELKPFSISNILSLKEIKGGKNYYGKIRQNHID